MLVAAKVVERIHEDMRLARYQLEHGEAPSEDVEDAWKHVDTRAKARNVLQWAQQLLPEVNRKLVKQTVRLEQCFSQCTGAAFWDNGDQKTGLHVEWEDWKHVVTRAQACNALRWAQQLLPEVNCKLVKQTVRLDQCSAPDLGMGKSEHVEIRGPRLAVSCSGRSSCCPKSTTRRSSRRCASACASASAPVLLSGIREIRKQVCMWSGRTGSMWSLELRLAMCCDGRSSCCPKSTASSSAWSSRRCALISAQHQIWAWARVSMWKSGGQGLKACSELLWAQQLLPKVNRKAVEQTVRISLCFSQCTSAAFRDKRDQESGLHMEGRVEASLETQGNSYRLIHPPHPMHRAIAYINLSAILSHGWMAGDDQRVRSDAAGGQGPGQEPAEGPRLSQ